MTTALVRGVIFRRMSSGSMPSVRISLSQNTGTNPHQIIGKTDAQNVAVGTSTSSPGSSPSA